MGFEHRDIKIPLTEMLSPHRNIDAKTWTISQRLERLGAREWWFVLNADENMRRNNAECVCADALGMAVVELLLAVTNEKIYVPGGHSLRPNKLEAMLIFKADDSNKKNAETGRHFVWIAWGTRPVWSPMEQLNGHRKVPRAVTQALRLYAAGKHRESRYAARLASVTAAADIPEQTPNHGEDAESKDAESEDDESEDDESEESESEDVERKRRGAQLTQVPYTYHHAIGESSSPVSTDDLLVASDILRRGMTTRDGLMVRLPTHSARICFGHVIYLVTLDVCARGFSAVTGT